MVWVYGGAYRFGTSGEDLYDGAALAHAGVVVVTVVDVVVCGAHRRLVQADTVHERIAVALRDAGFAAVIRPDANVRPSSQLG